LALWAGGASRLADGLDEVASGFESGLGGASATKLAAPVEVRVERTAPVPSNGQAFAPYFSALSLWVGALMMSFVFYLRRLPDSMQSAPRPIKWFAKASTLLVLGALQATVVVGLMSVVPGIHFAPRCSRRLRADGACPPLGSWCLLRRRCC
jgi:putative membrane protein